jgi:copper chaperone
MTHATIQIHGMSCSHCIRAINNALSALPGVEVESVAIGWADVRFDEAMVTLSQLTAAVSDAGYSASLSDVGR